MALSVNQYGPYCLIPKLFGMHYGIGYQEKNTLVVGKMTKVLRYIVEGDMSWADDMSDEY